MNSWSSCLCLLSDGCTPPCLASFPIFFIWMEILYMVGGTCPCIHSSAKRRLLPQNGGGCEQWGNLDKRYGRCGLLCSTRYVACPQETYLQICMIDSFPRAGLFVLSTVSNIHHAVKKKITEPNRQANLQLKMGFRGNQFEGG